jgi:hypothetical protein
VVVEVVDLTIGIDVDGVFMDMHATNATRGVACIEEGEEVLATQVEHVEVFPPILLRPRC